MSQYGRITVSICFVDLIITTILIHLGIVVEANPFMNFFLKQWGLCGFIISKVFLFTLIPVHILELGLRKIPERTIVYYRFLIVTYLITLSVGSYVLNFT